MRQRHQYKNLFIGVGVVIVLASASLILAFPALSEVAKPSVYAMIGQPVTLDYTLPVICPIKENKIEENKQELTKSDKSTKKAENGKNPSENNEGVKTENGTINTTTINTKKKGGEKDKSDHEKPTLSLVEAKGTKNLVLFFLSEQCGVTFFYKSRLQQIQKDFAGKGFVFVGVRGGKRQNPDEPLELAETNYLKMPFVDDTNGALIRYFRVRQSLTFAVIDREGRLRYRGGFDDSVDAAHVKKSYLRNALRDIAAGKPVAIKEGSAIGCAIVAGP